MEINRHWIFEYHYLILERGLVTASEFLQQAYWWLSLFGCLHCGLLSIVLWVKGQRQPQRSSNWIVIAIFMTLSLYFFTGMVNRDNAPIPIHVFLAMLMPTYFLLMPLVYLYCKYELVEHARIGKKNVLLHSLPSIIVAFIIITFSVMHFTTDVYLESDAIRHQGSFSFTLLGVILPIALLVQMAWYFFSIARLIRKQSASVSALKKQSVDGLKIRWLLVLTMSIIANWLIRCILVSVSFWFGDDYLLASETAMRFSLLMTLYVLAIYRLQQLTVIAYHNGLIDSSTAHYSKFHDVLDHDEKAFLSSIFKEKEVKK